MTNIIFNTIKDTRMKAGIWKLKDFAALVGTSPTWASKWESGKAVPKFKYLMKMCEVLNTTLNDLYPNKEKEAAILNRNAFIQKNN